MTIRSGCERAQELGVELVDRVAGGGALAHRRVDLARRSRPAGSTSRVARGSARAAAGWSHSWVTAISSSPRPSAKQSSVAWGTRLTIRIPQTLWNRCPNQRSPSACAALGRRWRREGDALVGDRERADFAAVIALVNRIAAEAERANHHPDLLIHGYKRLRITLSTHAAVGHHRARLRARRGDRRAAEPRCAGAASALATATAVPATVERQQPPLHERRTSSKYAHREPAMNWLLVRPGRRAGPPQRVLRDRRVLARALAALAYGDRRRAGPARRAARAAPAREHQRVHLDLPGRQHDGLDRHRRDGRAGDRPPVRARVRQRRRPRGRRRDRRGRRLPADHRRPDHRRRDGAQALRDRPRRARRAADRPAAAVLPRPLPPVHHRADRDLERDARRARRRSDAAHLAGRLARRAQAADPRVRGRRHARDQRGDDALRRLPPPRAGGPPGDDADPGGRDRRRRGGRRDRAAALHRLRPHAADRHRGREPRPDPRRRPRDRARAAAARQGPARVDRAARARHADRARRPSRSTTCSPSCSASASRSPWSPTSTAASSAS